MATWRDRPLSFQAALKAAKEILSASTQLVERGSIEAEAEQIVLEAYHSSQGKVLTRMELYSRYQDRFPEDAADRVLIWAGARAEGKLLQHLTGVQVFLDHRYEVGPDVLVPRPETEGLFVVALGELRKDAMAGRPPKLGLEIGIGSGILSTELLIEFESLRMVATELQPDAAKRALSNARRILKNGIERLDILPATDPLQVLEPFKSRVEPNSADFLISNPPYLAESDPIEEGVRMYEPHSALFAPASDAIHFYRAVAMGAREFLKTGGYVFMELAPERADAVLSLFLVQGWKAKILPDLNERARVLVAN